MTGPAWSTDWGPCITNTWGCSSLPPPPFPYAIKQNCRWPAQMIVKSVSRGSNNHGPHTCPSLKRSAAVWFKCSRSWRTWLLMGMGDDTWSGLIYFMPRIISMIRLKLKRLKLWILGCLAKLNSSACTTCYISWHICFKLYPYSIVLPFTLCEGWRSAFHQPTRFANTLHFSINDFFCSSNFKTKPTSLVLSALQNK